MLETGSIEQTVAIPTTENTLSLLLAIFQTSGNGTDFIRVFVDGVQVYEALESDARAGIAYYTVNIDVSAYSGTSVPIRIESTISGAPALTNFFVDDVRVRSCTAPIGVTLLGADVTFSPTTPALASFYTDSCTANDVRLDVAQPNVAPVVVTPQGMAAATPDSAGPGTANTLRYYQFECAGTGPIFMYKTGGAVWVGF